MIAELNHIDEIESNLLIDLIKTPFTEEIYMKGQYLYLKI